MIQVEQSNTLHEFIDECPLDDEVKGGDTSHKKIKLISRLASADEPPALETSQIDSMIMKH